VKVAFAKRLRSGTKDELKPRLLANLTLSILNVAIVSWYRGEYHDISTATNEVFSNLTRIICGQTKPSQAKKTWLAEGSPLFRPGEGHRGLNT